MHIGIGLMIGSVILMGGGDGLPVDGLGFFVLGDNGYLDIGSNGFFLVS